MSKAPTITIQLKRAWDAPTPEDGYRVLTDRLWPRGISRENAHLDLWLKDIAPSTELRKWFGHDPALWEEFQLRYRSELVGQEEALDNLLQHPVLTLVFAAKDVEHNNAQVLRQVLLERASTDRH